MPNKPYSWLYVIEGCISMCVVVWAFVGLPNDPTRAKFWKPEEKQVMLAREIQRQEYLGSQVFEWKEVANAVKDPKVWVTYVRLAKSPPTSHLLTGYCSALIQFFQDIILYGFSTFLPSILKFDLGFSPIEAQYLSVPVYFLGGVTFFVSSVTTFIHVMVTNLLVLGCGYSWR